MTHKEFLEVFKLLQLNYEKEVDDEIIKLWYEEFKNTSKEVFRKSVVDTIKVEPYFPTMEIVNKHVAANSRRQL